MLNRYQTDMWRTTFKASFNQRFRPYKIISLTLLLFSTILLLASLGFIGVIVSRFNLALLIVGSVIFLVASLLFIIAYFTIRYRLFYQIMLPNMMESLSNRMQQELEVEVFPKTDRKIHRYTGLFTRSASASHTFKVNFVDETLGKVQIFYSKFVVSTGNSAHQVFKGFLFHLPTVLNTNFQVRSRQKPSLKGVRFDEIEATDDLKLFAEKDLTPTNTMRSHLAHAQALYQKHNPKHLYVSVSELGTWYAVEPKKKVLSKQSLKHEHLESFYQHLKDHVMLYQQLYVA